MPPPPFTPRQQAEADLTMALLLVARIYRRMVDRRLADHAISEARAVPILYIARAARGGAQEAMRQGELAEMIGIEGPSLVRLLDQLGSAGLIERHPDPSDRRAKTMHITEAGQALAHEVEVVLREMRGGLLGEVSDEDLAATLRTLGTLNAALRTTIRPPED